MFKRLGHVFIFALLLGTFYGTTVHAGDVATFADVGFSVDGKYYMFGQYGVDSDSLKPWAELYTVDVHKNTFIDGGVKKTAGKNPVQGGKDYADVFASLQAENKASTAKFGISDKNQGTVLYIAQDSNPSTKITFRDFDGPTSYEATLHTHSEGKGNAIKSSFYIGLKQTTKDGGVKTLVVGNPAYKRAGISSYQIRRATLAPGGKSLVFLIEMRKNSAKGPDIRYMIETVRL